MTKSGYIAIIGRPNVGKSTLLNSILGQKISITARKPQTTRHRIAGIKTVGDVQAVYVDTPGLHANAKKALNRHLNRVVRQVIHDVDVIIFMVDGYQWLEEDQLVNEAISDVKAPVLLVINKIDKIQDKSLLLPHIKFLAEQVKTTEIIPLSAKKGAHIDELEAIVARYLPPGPFLFPEDQLTDRSERFIAAEIIREKLTRLLGQELPYALTVEIEQFNYDGKLLRISALIWVEKETQKAIVIGTKGERLKEVGQKSRLAMEKFFDHHVFLQLWVKVKQNWADDENALRQLGYQE